MVAEYHWLPQLVALRLCASYAAKITPLLYISSNNSIAKPPLPCQSLLSFVFVTGGMIFAA